MPNFPDEGIHWSKIHKQYEVVVLGKSFTADRIERKVMRNVKNKEMRYFFKLFQTLLPDHVGKDNTFVYYLESKRDMDILFVNTHFEGISTVAVAGLAAAMTDILPWSKLGEIYLEFWDAYWEKIILKAVWVHGGIFYKDYRPKYKPNRKSIAAWLIANREDDPKWMFEFKDDKKLKKEYG